MHISKVAETFQIAVTGFTAYHLDIKRVEQEPQRPQLEGNVNRNINLNRVDYDDDSGDEMIELRPINGMLLLCH